MSLAEQMKINPKDLLALLKAEAERQGYRFEVDADGTERMIRPDGSVAIIARKCKND